MSGSTISTRRRWDSGTLGDLIDRILDHETYTVSEVLSTLNEFLLLSRESLTSLERRAQTVVRHLDFLLRDGETLYADCEVARDSWMRRSIIIRRIVKSDTGIEKVHAQLSSERSSHDPRAFHAFIEGPSVIIYKNPLTVGSMRRDVSIEMPEVLLNEQDIRALYATKQLITNCMQVAKGSGVMEELDIRKAIEEDRQAIAEAFLFVSTQPLVEVYSKRGSHPYRGPQLHILPRLVGPHSGRSVLRTIAEDLEKLATRGFEALMVGVVDKQSTHVYYGESDQGNLIPYINNHGYWSSGQTGIDARIGSEQEYCDLLARAAELNVGYTQDSTFGTLGYPPQLARFSASTISRATTSLSFEAKEEVLWNRRVFLHDLCIPEENGLDDRVSVDHYTDVISQTHLGAPYALPKPNLFAVEVCRSITARALWQIRECGVYSLRVDMAKHIGIPQLRSIIGSLREAVERRASQISGSACKRFSIILEYWTVKYRDLRFSMHSLQEEVFGVYYYDFPLAHALQQIFINRLNAKVIIARLIAERRKWGIDLRRLIPVFVDHDFNFKPIYNGSEESCAIVVGGVVLCTLLSANAPIVYIGYSNRDAGPARLADYFLYSEQYSRRVVEGVFCADDPDSPERAIAEMFRIVEEKGILENWDDEDITVGGDGSEIWVARSYCEKGTNEKRAIKACFALGEQRGNTVGRGGRLLFAYSRGLQVEIYDDAVMA